MPIKPPPDLQTKLAVSTRQGDVFPLAAGHGAAQVQYQNSRGQLFQGDSIRWLQSLDAASVDLVFADPPYNIKKADWDEFETLDHYVAWSREWISETARVLKPSGTHYVCALMFTAAGAEQFDRRFLSLLAALRESASDTPANRVCLNRSICTLQQCIGAALDALPASRSNTARKINGDLFERLISLVLARLGIDCASGSVRAPIEVDGVAAFTMSYQHDLVLREGDLWHQCDLPAGPLQRLHHQAQPARRSILLRHPSQTCAPSPSSATTSRPSIISYSVTCGHC